MRKLVFFSIVLSITGCTGPKTEELNNALVIKDSLQNSLDQLQEEYNTLKRDYRKLENSNLELKKRTENIDLNSVSGGMDQDILVERNETEKNKDESVSNKFIKVTDEVLEDINRTEVKPGTISEGVVNIEDKKIVDPVPIARIKTYYKALENRETKKAYEMKQSESVDFATFQAWYGLVEVARPRDFQQLNNGNQFQFFVDYTDEDRAGAVYKIVMEVTGGGKLITIASWKVSEGEKR